MMRICNEQPKRSQVARSSASVQLAPLLAVWHDRGIAPTLPAERLVFGLPKLGWLNALKSLNRELQTVALRCPARVGEPSRHFLTWNGTELICAGGHGLLHVPELPTSWFSKPRWLHLDASWNSIFLGTT